MKLTVTQLENRVKEINEWLLNHPNDPNRKQKEQSRNYYVDKLAEMDEYNLKSIEI